MNRSIVHIYRIRKTKTIISSKHGCSQIITKLKKKNMGVVKLAQ